MNMFMPKGRVRIGEGSVDNPESSSLRLIVVPCSESGSFDGELQKLLTKKWAKAREEFRTWFANRQNFKLGEINNTAVASDIWIMYALVEDKDGNVNTDAMKKCMKKIGDLAKYEKASIHLHQSVVDMSDMESFINDNFVNNGVNVFKYAK